MSCLITFVRDIDKLHLPEEANGLKRTWDNVENNKTTITGLNHRQRSLSKITSRKPVFLANWIASSIAFASVSSDQLTHRCSNVTPLISNHNAYTRRFERRKDRTVDVYFKPRWFWRRPQNFWHKPRLGREMISKLKLFQICPCPLENLPSWLILLCMRQTEQWGDLFL